MILSVSLAGAEGSLLYTPLFVSALGLARNVAQNLAQGLFNSEMPRNRGKVLFAMPSVSTVCKSSFFSCTIVSSFSFVARALSHLEKSTKKNVL